MPALVGRKVPHFADQAKIIGENYDVLAGEYDMPIGRKVKQF